MTTLDPFQLADALDAVAEGIAKAAMVLRIGAETPQDAPGGASFDELPPDEYETIDDRPWAEHSTNPAGSAAVCPAHNIPYRKGRYGSYCPSTSDDPKWSNDKGYCTVSPKNAAAWLRQHA